MLILTEKPSVARAFADALGVTRKDNCYENSDHCVVNALGHLLEDYSPEDYNPDLKKWSLDGLPIIPEQVKYKAVEKTKAQLAVVKNCFSRHKNDPFLLATDAEREGELIGAEILDYVGFKNYPNARRFWVSEALTPEVIKKGIENAKPLADYKSYREQGFARQFADWLVGMNLTRLISLKANKTLHFGRVQTAVLGAVYEREKSILNFTSEKYYEVIAVLDTKAPSLVKLINPDNKDFPFRFCERSSILREITSKIPALTSGEITAVKKEKKTVQPPQLFNITGLQKEAHKQFGYTPEQTLDIAQALYEKHKCLSYPRTPSRVMGDDNVKLIKSIYEKLIEEYSDAGTCHEEYIKGSDPSLIDSGNKRLFNSEELQDHHALIPLEPLPADTSDEENNVYDLVYERFFSILKPPYIYNSLIISGNISEYSFQGSGIEILQSGWKTENEEYDENKENYKYSIPPEPGKYPIIHIHREEKQTKPKDHYTFASLLQLMENPRGDDGKHHVRILNNKNDINWEDGTGRNKI
jgi:DNA topoisomerase-3